MDKILKRETFLPFSKPCIGRDEIGAVVGCLKSGWITSGPLAKQFEEEFAEMVGAPYSVSVSSGTAGLHLLLHAFGIGEGDEIITSPMGFATTVNMISLVRAKPVFVDIDYDNLMLKPELLEEKISSKTKAILPVHMAGLPCDLDPLLDLAGKKDLLVIQDAAHCLGTTYKGKHIGSQTGTSVFSFQAIKNITSAEGGMVTCHDDKLAERIRRLRFHGIERLAWDRYKKHGTPQYDITDPGYKYNYPDILAAIALAQIKRLEEINKARQILAMRYLANLDKVEGIDLPPTGDEEHTHSWHLFIIKIKIMDRDVFMARLQEYNIGTGLHFPACHLLSYIRKDFGYKKGDFPECERAAERIVSLPLFPDMTVSDVDYVCSAIKEIIGS